MKSERHLRERFANGLPENVNPEPASGFTLNLSQKGLIIVAVPLIFEIIFLCTLGFLLKHAEVESDRQRRSQAIISQSSVLIKLFDDATETIGGYSLTKSPLFSNRYRHVVDQIPSALNDLERLVGDNASEQEIVKQVRETALAAVNVLSEEKSAIDADSAEAAQSRLRQTFPRIRSAGARLQDNLMSLTADERKIESQTPEKIKSSRAAVQSLIVIGAVCSIFLAVVVALFFSRGISDRLAILIDNSYRLSKAELLLPPVSGTDEIAHLDGVFHTMADTLTEALRKQRALIENARDVICSLDGRGTFTAVSSAATTVFGYSPEELVGGSLLNIIPDDEADNVVNSLGTVKAGTDEAIFEFRLIRKDRKVIDVLWSAHWSDIEGTMFCVVHDISERKGAERLRQEVTQMVAHDMRTPLTVIQSFHGMLSTGMVGSLDEKGAHLLKLADSNTGRMLGMINDLLEVEKMEAGALELEKSNVSLASIFDQAVQTSAVAAKSKGVRLSAKPTDLVVCADENRLVQILVNLLSNAVKFTPPEAQIVVSAARLPDCVEIKVQDQGSGIPAHLTKTIFDRFKQVQSSDSHGRKGFGLGLAICKALVELHGGVISVESEIGVGSTFSFRIPG